MWGRWTAPRRLAESAGFKWRHVREMSELTIATLAACSAAHRVAPADVPQSVAMAAEELLHEEAAYELVVALIENLQNLSSHGLEQLRTPDEITAVLGPRSLVVWNAVDEFWTAVARWRRATGEPLPSNEDVLSVEDEGLRANLWTSIRSLDDGTRVGLSEAVLFEKAGGAPIPGYRELMAAGQ
ncbi:hypothetical protein [Lentzea sp. NEAU-D7]|uniref:hypothetical protein n=1 Tax=Lentzea sp. NEAU-D7 TaxID=2994667 RepID=UPI00224B41CB|nr:hypothetical protein [Lentzea sp. NEAU-D7]MCX2947998.1 hypothetical protein [Lentzea sp. NEAU-D7]